MSEAALAFAQPIRRSLSATERRFLRAKQRRFSKTARRYSARAILVIAAVSGIFCLLTFRLSPVSPTLVAAFWAIFCIGLTLWLRHEVVKRLENDTRRMTSALRRNAVDAYDVRAKSYVEFEEVEDEGASYAFELEDGRCLFIAGQDFYPRGRFPSLSFSLIYILDENDRPLEALIAKKGPRAEPLRIVSEDHRQKSARPQHLQITQSLHSSAGLGWIGDPDSMRRD